ncbi:MAG: YciI family protein [Acidimicrobiia bacterium]
MAESLQFLYQFAPGDRPELLADPEAWTAEDERIAGDHYEYLRRATVDGVVLLAGRSLDRQGPAVVVFEAESAEAARRFMCDDPFLKYGLFTAELHPFSASLVRGQVPPGS